MSLYHKAVVLEMKLFECKENEDDAYLCMWHGGCQLQWSFARVIAIEKLEACDVLCLGKTFFSFVGWKIFHHPEGCVNDFELYLSGI